MTDYETRRNEMVERQIAARGVSDPLVLDAMRKVPARTIRRPGHGRCGLSRPPAADR